MYAVRRWFEITKEGPKEGLFLEEKEKAASEVNKEGKAEDDTPAELPNLPSRSSDGFQQEEIANMVAAGVVVDDDNQPAPENVPIEGDEMNAGVQYKDWGYTGICYRRQLGSNKFEPRLNTNCATREKQQHMNRGAWFLMLFPMRWLWYTIFEGVINSQLPDNLKIEYWEVIRFIGIWFLLATVQGHPVDSFWDKQPSDRRFKGAPFTVNDLMTKTRFQFIKKKLRYYSNPLPSFKDRFHAIRELQYEWNRHMKEVFVAGWLVCLDESMSKWINRYTCPGFVFCPRKPWPFGNEYHTIACVQSSIIFYVEMVEGKDQPNDLGPLKYNKLDGMPEQKTVGLLLHMTEALWHSSRVVVLDSGFCVLQGLIELAKRGLFAAAVIKKRRYWPKYIHGDKIDKHFSDKPVGYQDALPGTLDGKNFHVFCLKEEDYVMKLMSTYGTLEIGSETKRILSNGCKPNFRYTEVFDNHFKGRHAVDNNNKQRMQPIALEETWDTEFWENRVFSFFLATTAANAQYAFQYFGIDKIKETVIKFLQQMAWDLIYNDYCPDEAMPEDDGRKRRKDTTPNNCELVRLPDFKKFK